MSRTKNIPKVHIDNVEFTHRKLLSLDDVKNTIWLTRPDIREMVEEDWDQFELWLIINGTLEYQALRDLELDLSTGFFTENAAEALPGIKPALTRFMKAIWEMRVDLHSTFDLNNADGQKSFVRWFFIVGIGELGLQKYVTRTQINELNEPISNQCDSSSLPITRLMKEVWGSRTDLQQAFNLSDSKERDTFVTWYFTHGMNELQLDYTIDESQAQELLSSAADEAPVSLIHMFIWSTDSELRDRFPDPNTGELSDWLSRSRLDYPVLDRIYALAKDHSTTSEFHKTSIGDLEFGVNLVGYAKGQFGIGEDVRMAALALQAAGIPFTIYNVEPGREVCQGDESAVDHISDALPYSVNVFCTTGIETARLAAVHGLKLFDGRYSIGYWPWELPEWPTSWHHAYNLVDEVWASSRFIYDAFAKSCPKPVRHMPMAVDVEPTAGLTRRDFQLPEERFLFVFSFDFLSSLARKNPEACILAFQKAFPHGDDSVGLVVKAMRATVDNPFWKELLEKVECDSRITIVNKTLERDAVLDLYRACDCFVSLHRSEGFGRGIAEAMMLGKPVITTGYSGNMDFTHEDNAGIVKYKISSVKEEHYPYGEGLSWAEPIVEHAAWWMSEFSHNNSLRNNYARKGTKVASSAYEPKKVGENYCRVLNEICQ